MLRTASHLTSKKLTHITNTDPQGQLLSRQDGFCSHLTGDTSDVVLTWYDLHTQYTTNLIGCKESAIMSVLLTLQCPLEDILGFIINKQTSVQGAVFQLLKP